MSPSRLRFDDFELRPDSGELFKDGTPVRLQPQPARVLAILASRPGEVVERDEIRRLVWGDSFLDFDASLNFCIKQIRQALGDSATAPRFVETLPRRGYRFLMPVSQEAPQVPAALSPRPQARKTLWLPLLSVAAMAGILVLLLGIRRAHPTTPRLVVLPFECHDRDRDGEICGGITEVITAELSRRFPRDLETLAPVSALVYSGKSGPEIARGLKATHVLDGKTTISNGEIRIDARLARTDGSGILWQESLSTDLRDAPLLYAQLLRGVARGLRLPPPPAAASKPKVSPSAAAYEQYLEGIYLLRYRPQEAASSLKNAVLLAPEFAPGYVALAWARLHEECQGSQAAATAARRALALDPDLAEAHLVLAEALFKCHSDWGPAGREFRQAMTLNPGDAAAYHRYAFYLAAQGRHGEAIAAVARARELDPASLMVESDFAYFLYLGHRYKEAVQQARQALELVSAAPDEISRAAAVYKFWNLWTLFHSAWKASDEDTAVSAGRGLMEFYGEGVKAEKVRNLEDFLSWQEAWLERRIRERPVPPYLFATALVEAGHYDRALDVLEGDCQGQRSYLLHLAAVEPGFDPLRGDPRFTRVLDCIRLPADAPARASLKAAESTQRTRDAT